MARTCVDALEPDLVILDEFQRFKDLLNGDSDDEAAQLAQTLFTFPDVRVLLLSATPYRMLTLDHEDGEDHYTDFLETVRFLFNDSSEVEALRSDLDTYRKSLLGLHVAPAAAATAARASIEARLRRVMVRTERVGKTAKRDSMVREPAVPTALRHEDVAQALAVDAVSREVGGGDQIDFWKSAPYLLNLMKDYQLKVRMKDQAGKPSAGLLSALRSAQPQLLAAATLSRYEAVPLANARIRSLSEATIEQGLWRLVWLPPSLPYTEPSGVYAGVAAATKSLVFSSWNVVPDAIAVLLSYEAERRAVAEGRGDVPAYERLHDRRRPLLTFRTDSDSSRISGMPTLALMYPCLALAREIDPLAMAIDHGGGQPLPLASARGEAKRQIEALLTKKGIWPAPQSDGPPDARWYWAAPALLDARLDPNALEWVENGWGAGDDEEDGESQGAFGEHAGALAEVMTTPPVLGRPPADLLEVLADYALASPAVCAARALLRVVPGLHESPGQARTPAATIARGLRALFNVPETMALLRGEDEGKPYWRRVLEYSAEGNLQAVLDEYCHVLRESLGLTTKPAAEAAEGIASGVASALSLRTASLAVDDIKVRDGVPRIDLEPFRVRCRFALRFGDIRDDNGAALTRAGTVRDSFNSPFRPFVLASTSIGQEGLDFHQYCHVLYHWNLPSNPVDLEQREGRVHRYKGHAVRRNVALAFGLGGLAGAWKRSGDPWEALFNLAKSSRPSDASDLVPYWLFEVDGGVAVERRVPMLPLSREHGQLERLRKSLAVYRLAFGQPRQQDLVAFLEATADAQGLDSLLQNRISLEPVATDLVSASVPVVGAVEEKLT
jgi:hypothetical protein